MKQRHRADWTERLVLGLMGLAVACTLTACAANKQLVATEDAIHDSLVKADDHLNAFCSAPANVEQFKAPCADGRRLMASTLDAAAVFNRAVRDQKISGLANLITAGGELLKALKALPQSATAEMITDIANAIAAAYRAAGGQ